MELVLDAREFLFQRSDSLSDLTGCHMPLRKLKWACMPLARPNVITTLLAGETARPSGIAQAGKEIARIAAMAGPSCFRDAAGRPGLNVPAGLVR